MAGFRGYGSLPPALSAMLPTQLPIPNKMAIRESTPTPGTSSAMPGLGSGFAPFNLPSLDPREMGTFAPTMTGMPTAMPPAMPAPAVAPSKGSRLVGILTDALSGLAGQPGQYARSMNEQHQREAESTQWNDRYERQRRDTVADRETERNRPQFFAGNEDRVEFNPVTGQSRTVYDAPTDAQTYASNLGLAAGTPEHVLAQRDFVLRASGPTAFDYRTKLEGARTDGRVQLEGVRSEARTALEGARTDGRVRVEGARGAGRTTLEQLKQSGRAALRGQPTYRDTHPLPPRTGAGRAAPAAKPTATDPTTGRKIQWNGSAWVPVG